MGCETRRYMISVEGDCDKLREYRCTIGIVPRELKYRGIFASGSKGGRLDSSGSVAVELHDSVYDVFLNYHIPNGGSMPIVWFVVDTQDATNPTIGVEHYSPACAEQLGITISSLE